ncbi:TatD family hydrolase [Candidatus Parcubacteria bacterium]|nr:TatD family hydrolase [Candidatus Parcubacteria bacterium]
MLVDTHAHLNFAAFDRDRDEVIKRCLDNNIWMINVGTNYETSKKAVEISKDYNERVYAAIGLHPINIKQNSKVKTQKSKPQLKTQNLEDILEENFNFNKYKELAKSKKVVAIGEIGLDYYYKPKTKKKLALFKEKQKALLEQELKLAEELNLPVIFHCRMAHDDLIEILEVRPPIEGLTSVIHSFTGTWEQAEKFLEMGFYLGFNGIVFKLDLDEIIKKTPLDRILIETDCPFLTPPLPAKALAKAGRNEPIFIKYIAEHIAKIKNIPLEKIAEITSTNAKKLFKI